jgi:hypothetical protein
MATPLPTIRHDTATPGDRLAGELRGFGPAGIVAIAVIALSGNVFAGHWAIPLGGLLVLVWTHVSGTPWRAIGYVRSKRWMAGVGLGLGLGVAFKLAMKAMVMPLLGADPINHAFHYLAGNRALLPSAMWMMLVAGFGEETVFRGFAFERLGKLLGTSVGAKAATVLLTSLWFGLAHWTTQGLPGTEQATIVGLIFGTIFAFTGRIWMLMCAHAAFDLTALGLIYWNLETRVAHLIFR